MASKSALLGPLNGAQLPVKLSDKALGTGTMLVGDRSRLRRVVQRLLSGAPITVGGSLEAAVNPHCVFSYSSHDCMSLAHRQQVRLIVQG